MYTDKFLDIIPIATPLTLTAGGVSTDWIDIGGGTAANPGTDFFDGEPLVALIHFVTAPTVAAATTIRIDVVVTDAGGGVAPTLGTVILGNAADSAAPGTGVMVASGFTAHSVIETPLRRFIDYPNAVGQQIGLIGARIQVLVTKTGAGATTGTIAVSVAPLKMSGMRGRTYPSGATT